ncbi:MAG: phytoene desaturase family protein [Gemmatimonadales bacterium]
MRGKPWDAVVIGAGANGLSAAIVLARAGRKVLVVERANQPGGRAAVRDFAPGFRTAPLGLEAGWLSPAVARATGIAKPDLVVPEVPLAVPAGDQWLLLSRRPDLGADVLRRHAPADAGKWSRFCERLERWSGIFGALYQLPPPGIEARRVRELLPLVRMAGRLRRLGGQDLVDLLRAVPLPVADLLDEWFESAALKAAVGAVGVTGLRQGPRSGGTGFLLLHHLVGAPRGTIGAGGGGYWRAGPTALIDALVEQARRQGVEVRSGAPVERIIVAEDRVMGVVLQGGEEVCTSAVLSSADSSHTLLALVDPVWLDPELLHAIRNIKYRGSTSVVSYGLDRLPEFAGVEEAARRLGGSAARHSALGGVFSLATSLEELERAADAAKYGRTSDRPFITVTLPSVRWPALAPSGKHVLVARVQWTPWCLRDGKSWKGEATETLGSVVDSALERVAPGFGSLVRAREVLTPVDLERCYGLTEGAPSHGELMLDQILFMRPVPTLAQYATPIDGLYLCGAGCHPGPGIPGGAGWLAARRVLRDFRSRPGMGRFAGERRRVGEP